MESVSIFEAFFGGMGEFPCNHHISTIPVFIGSLAGAWLLRTGMRRVCLPVMLHSIFFITGTSLTLAFTGIASLGNGFFINYFQALSIGACIIIILTGIYLIASTRFPVIDYETRLSYRHSLISGYLRALVIGVFYGFLVTPCLSPTLAAIIIHFYPAIYTAVSTGLRQSELLGLRWRDVDPDITLSISVNRVLFKRKGICEFKQPKTERSRRRVAMTTNLAIFLREYRQDRNFLYKIQGKELALDDLVFAYENGKPLDPTVLTHNFKRIAKQSGIENVRFHDLRHTFASLMLLKGAAPKVISEALGHSSVAFTMDVYSHIIPGMQEDAMVKLNSVIPSGDTNFQKFNTKLTPLVNITSVNN